MWSLPLDPGPAAGRVSVGHDADLPEGRGKKLIADRELAFPDACGTSVAIQCTHDRLRKRPTCRAIKADGQINPLG
jgi:hypothetical protein